ncbi:MAG: hypothetical protein P4M11_15575 [Candidatus Pacebacteria bacterium]|nr:hypothetical protein [Candidatus Paceibacterota bacterium]
MGAELGFDLLDLALDVLELAVELLDDLCQLGYTLWRGKILEYWLSVRI